VKSRFHAGRWLTRLGVVSEEQPEVIPVLQPTISVGDHSGLFAPLPPPTTLFSQFLLPTATQFATFIIIPRAPGGCWFDLFAQIFTFVTVQLRTVQVSVSDSPWGGAAAADAARTNLFLSTASVLQFVDDPTAITPSVQVGATGTFNNEIALDRVYLPPGRVFAFQFGVNDPGIVRAMIRDVPEVQPDPIG